jgi:hypothetical protein
MSIKALLHILLISSTRLELLQKKTVDDEPISFSTIGFDHPDVTYGGKTYILTTLTLTTDKKPLVQQDQQAQQSQNTKQQVEETYTLLINGDTDKAISFYKEPYNEIMKLFKDNCKVYQFGNAQYYFTKESPKIFIHSAVKKLLKRKKANNSYANLNVEEIITELKKSSNKLKTILKGYSSLSSVRLENLLNTILKVENYNTPFYRDMISKIFAEKEQENLSHSKASKRKRKPKY